MTELKIDIYADGADIAEMKKAYQGGRLAGFTTNPSLMKKAGVKDYKAFAKEVVAEFPHLPISFEVFGDDFATMEQEAEIITQFGPNVFVKIPVMNSKGESSVPLIKKLSEQDIKLNITAIFTVEQVKAVVNALKPGVKNVVSVFAGRIADTGVDPIDIMRQSVDICRAKEGAQLLWASPREVLNIIQADQVGADIITCTPDLIAKLDGLGKDLTQFSQETVQMFLRDSTSLGFSVL
ncbi:transaldolase [Amphibacillus marinus]|uniref:Transaldolase n=1 Tax=Amphibacillus marinus TaxID=872970 RepID=A0A1H8MWJ9_9BACI|nr:transaldolase [Amphibacillus marinus]SEO21727.1 transaldolase [Amphibacillus marinus]